MASRNKSPLFTPSKSPSHRTLRVGEEVRHLLSSLFLRGDLPEPGLPTSVTITQVHMSPDLQNATVYIMPLGGQFQEESLSYLKDVSSHIRYHLGKEMSSKFTPALRFRLDDSFEQAERIEKLLTKLR